MGSITRLPGNRRRPHDLRLCAPTDLADDAVAKFKQLAAQHDFAIYDRSRPEFDRLTVEFICKALLELGFNPTPGRRFDARAEASRNFASHNDTRASFRSCSLCWRGMADWLPKALISSLSRCPQPTQSSVSPNSSAGSATSAPNSKFCGGAALNFHEFSPANRIR